MVVMVRAFKKERRRARGATAAGEEGRGIA
jgi:hypothetical protein